MLNRKLGQVFTREPEVKKMISLIENNGKILEPSCGDGAFFNRLPTDRTVGIEIDSTVAPKNAKVMDFFDERDTYDTIIGNPPYLMYKEIPTVTLPKLPRGLDKRANLYMFFIWRCIDLLNKKGELIFIVPRDFIKLSGSYYLNKRLFDEGGFTYWEELGDKNVFDGATPNVVIFRWVKGANHTIPVSFNDGYLYFSKIENGVRLDEVFDVKVGAVSGANNIFYNENGNISLANSESKKTGKLIKAIYGKQMIPIIENFKNELLKRTGSSFNEENWWDWIRKPVCIKNNKILVNCKTRDTKPFFSIDCDAWDGSLLALIPKKDIDINKYVDILNNIDWNKQGFKVGGRLIFSQRSLSHAIIPFEKL